MIEFLHIPGNEYFEDCSLNNLGKINVLCGKNNSGKTTTLNNIFDEQKKAHLGKRISWDEVKGVFGIGNGSSVNPFNSQFLIDSLKRIFKEKEIWFENEEEKLHDLIRPYFQTWAVQNSYGGNFSLPNLHPIFNTSFKKILIPPRRSIQHTVKLDAKEKVSASGSGIINNIFYCKNRTDKKSDEWKAYEELNKAFTIVSGGYEFLLELTSSNNINLQYSLNGASAIGAEVSGIGLHNILILLYFSIFPGYDIILIEEPETHLHAATQKRLLTYWQEETNKQFFLTTHSNVFLDNSYVDRIFLTQYKNATISVTENSNRAEILHDLGYSVADNLISDLTILCEGPSDVPVLEELLKKMGLLDKYNIKAHFMGGDTMSLIDLTVFTSHHCVLALIDRDPGSQASRNKFIRNCEKHTIPVHQLERYAIENYFTARALKAVFKAQISEDFKEVLPDKTLVEQIKIDVKKNNRKIAKELTLDEVEGTDLKEFLDLVAETCKNTQRELTEDS